jgi:zinc transporter ZupT
MKRTIAAFLVAPLWIPLTAYLLTEFVYGFEPNPWYQSYLVLAFQTLVGYGATLLFGLPPYLLLRRRRLNHLLVALGLGFVAGVVMWLAYVVLYTIVTPACTWQDAWENVKYSVSTLPEVTFILETGLFGSLVGLTLWAILRPNFAEYVRKKGHSGK